MFQLDFFFPLVLVPALNADGCFAVVDDYYIKANLKPRKRKMQMEMMGMVG